MNALNEIGTTGLVAYVASYAGGRTAGLALGRAWNVLRRRGYPQRVYLRFKHACSIERNRIRGAA